MQKLYFEIFAMPADAKFSVGGSLGVKQVNAAGAVEGLTTDPATILIDIRNKAEIKEQGTPDLAATKKKAILLPFTQADSLLDFSWLKKKIWRRIPRQGMCFS